MRFPGALLAFLSAGLHGARLAAADDLAAVVAAQPNLTMYSGLIKSYPSIFANLPEGITIAAPSDSAFRKVSSWDSKNASLAQPLLQYSILHGSISMGSIEKGQSVFVQTLLNDSTLANVTGGQNVILTKQPDGGVVLTSGLASRGTVVNSDIQFQGGLVQVVDSLAVVPTTLEGTAFNAYNDLEAFVGALYAAGLESDFANAANVTLFIPRNAAFQLVAGALSKLDNATLAKVLQYHMVPKLVLPESQMKDNLTLITAGGKTIEITRFNNDIFVNAARVIQTNILIANGVVQMLDNVLNPDDAAAPDTAVYTQSPAFSLVGATETGTAAPTPFITDLPCTSDCSSGGGGGNGTARPTASGGAKSTSSPGFASPAKCTPFGGIGIGLAVAAAGVAGVGYLG